MHHGKEVYLFFNIHGIYGIIGILISQILIGIIIYKVLIISKNKDLSKYTQLIENISSNHKLNEIIKVIINMFLLITFYIMIAGFSAYFAQELGVPNIVGTAVILSLCYITLKGNIEGVTKLNTLVIPVLIIYITMLATKNIDAFENINQKAVDANFLKSIYKSILYSSYNSITLIPIIISLKDYVKDKKAAAKIAIVSTILLIILAISIYGLTLKVDIDINMLELPIVYVAGMSGKMHKYIYGAIILIAIFTSAISTGYSLLKPYEGREKKYKARLIILCISAIPISKLGFSNLINIIYPVFGLLGLVQIVLIMKKRK